MEKAPDADGGDASEPPLTYKTWMLRVSIHCGGCRKKVKKVLQSIEGVYKIEIDSKKHQVVVTGNVEAGTLIKKLIKSGKNAELWTHAAAGEDGNRKTDQADGQAKDNDGDSSGEDHADDKGGPPAAAAPPGGGGGKKKKKKKKKKGNAAAGFTVAGGAPAPAAVGGPPPGDAPADPSNGSHPRQQVFSYPQFYYPAPEYGMSYGAAAAAAAPTAAMAASHYTLPMHSYTYFQPDCYPTPPPSNPIMDDETFCKIM